MIIPKPRIALKWLLGAIVFLVAGNCAGIVSKYFFHHDSVFGLVPLFLLDKEANLPTWLASITLFVCSLLLVVIAVSKRTEGDRYHRHWFFLSLVFLVMSIDETACLHEYLIGPLRRFFHATGIFYYTWVILGIAVVLAMALLFWKFIISIPARIRTLFMISAGIYVGGALVMEMIDGWYYNRIGRYDFVYALMTSWEETLELVGVALFIYSLLTYMGSKFVSIRIDFPGDG